jgi:hypothetical protein
MIAQHSSSNLALSVDPSRKMYNALMNLDFTYANNPYIKHCSNFKNHKKKRQDYTMCVDKIECFEE